MSRNLHHMARILLTVCCLLLCTALDASAAPGRGTMLDHARHWRAAAVSDAASISAELLRWNQIALDTVANDHSFQNPDLTYSVGDQAGPARSSRALAIVHLAMFDALNALEGRYRSYIPISPPRRPVSAEAAIAQAAHDTLTALYPTQAARIDQDLVAALSELDASSGLLARGAALGAKAAQDILSQREDDGSDACSRTSPDTFSYPQGPGLWQPDPLHPSQEAYCWEWGSVHPFALTSGGEFRAQPPPALDSEAFQRALEEVKRLGGDGVITPTERTPEQTQIGIFWAYDSTPHLGVPLRLYNKIVRIIANNQGTEMTPLELARLFALENAAMADAAIACWETKYFYDLWRPITAIRSLPPEAGGDPTFTPLGAPASNSSGTNFTPPFPTYTSGHATFGAAAFQVLRMFYNRDDLPFSVVSDEFNGVTTDENGVVRPRVVRQYASLTQAEEENARSRIYLGIHWNFDASEGITQGEQVATAVAERILSPRTSP